MGAGEQRPVVEDGELAIATVMTSRCPSITGGGRRASARDSSPTSRQLIEDPLVDAALAGDSLMADTQFRPHRHRRRARRLCRRDPRRPARHEDRDRRARAPGRHLPQLGLHPDQGAAALGRGQGAAAPPGRLRLRRRERQLRPRQVVKRSRGVAKQLSGGVSS